MSSDNRAAIKRGATTLLMAALLALPLAGCGFHPMYGDASRTAGDLVYVKINPTPERLGQVITTELQDGFNPSGIRVLPKYSLDVALTKSEADQLERSDGTASRTEVSVYATYILHRLSDNLVLTAGTARSISGFDVMSSAYTNLVADQSIQLREGRDLAEQVRSRIALYLESGAEQASDDQRQAAVRAAKLRGDPVPAAPAPPVPTPIPTIPTPRVPGLSVQPTTTP